MKRIQLIISGYVQGVGFRAYTQKQAQRLGLSGFVRNRSDGSVEVQAQGNEEALNRLIQWTHRGAPTSDVESVVENELPINESEQDFRIQK